MGNSVSSFLVVLREDINEEYAEQIINALKLIDGVLTVEVATGAHDVAVAKHRLKSEFYTRLWEYAKSW